jgi:hypothetical protein
VDSGLLGQVPENEARHSDGEEEADRGAAANGRLETLLHLNFLYLRFEKPAKQTGRPSGPPRSRQVSRCST